MEYLFDKFEDVYNRIESILQDLTYEKPFIGIMVSIEAFCIFLLLLSVSLPILIPVGLIWGLIYCPIFAVKWYLKRRD